MATTYPSGSSSMSDNSAITTLIGVLALVAIVALVYFIFAGARDRNPSTIGGANPAAQTMDNGENAPAVPPANQPARAP